MKKQNWQERIAHLASVKEEPRESVAAKGARRAQEKLAYSQAYTKANARRFHLRRYGLTEEDFEALCKEQNGQCAICRNLFTSTPYVDHDHKTGIVRGLLCSGCNTGLGMFKDHPDILLEAANYIVRHTTLVEKMFKAKYKL